MTPEVSPFIVGCHRSGTTLLRLMLSAHPAIAIPEESHFIPWFLSRRRRYERPAGFSRERFITDLLSHPRFRAWDLPGQLVRRALGDETDALDLIDALRLTYAAYAGHHGKEVAGDKTPPYVTMIQALAATFPGARFIHPIRDGRNVTLSLLDMPWGPRTVATAAVFWNERVRAGRTAGETLGPERYLEYRHEDLIADPEATLRRICAFIDRPFDPAMLGWHEGRAPTTDPTFQHLDRPLTGGLRDFRAQMAPHDLMLCEAIARDSLRALGYEPVTEPDESARAAAAIALAARGREIAGAGGDLRHPRERQSARGGPRFPPRRASREPPPFVFFTGCQRSGTTLLRAIFDANSQLAISPESHFIPDLAANRARYEGDGSFDVATFLADLRAHPRFHDWTRRITARDLKQLFKRRPPADLPDAIRWMYRLMAWRLGKTRYADKTPRYAGSIPLLADLFPESRFVHIIRDGRNVALSVMEAPFGPTELDRAALYWRARVSAARSAGRALGAGRYFEFRYETLLDDPEAVARAICTFIDVPFEERMLSFHERRREPRSAHMANLNKPITKGLRDWRTRLDGDDVALFEALAGDLLDDLGYERGIDAFAIPGRVRLRAVRARVRDRISRNPVSRLV
ncbi:MAG TPA: sulfotransferase [Actinomycetota bacterium]